MKRMHFFLPKKYVLIEFTNNTLSFYVAKKESTFYTVTPYTTIALSTISTEIADGSIYNPTRIKDYLSQTIKTLRLTKPKTIFFVPALQGSSEDVKNLQTLQIALCSFNLPIELSYIVPISVESLASTTDNKMRIPLLALQEALITDVLHFFKPSHHHQAPLTYIILTISSLALLGIILYFVSAKVNKCTSLHQTTTANLESTTKELQGKITPLKKQAKKTKKLTNHNIDPEILQKNNKTIQTLLHDIEQAILDDTYLTSITITSAQAPQSPIKPKNSQSKKKKALTDSKTLLIKGCTAVPPSAMKLFMNLEGNPALENVSISHLEENSVNSDYQFSLQATIKNLTS